MSTRLCDVCQTQQGSTHHNPTTKQFECDDCDQPVRRLINLDELDWEHVRFENTATGEKRIIDMSKRTCAQCGEVMDWRTVKESGGCPLCGSQDVK